MLILRSILMLGGLIGSMMATEVALRIHYPDGGMPAAHLASSVSESQAAFHEDPECGYLPVTGRGEYSAEGCMPNEYDLKKPRAQRVLFVGDSVTHRGRIMKALRGLYGEKYEYWNAGVESFNTVQEWALYHRYNYAIHPDQVVLAFHNNDFLATPLVVHEKGQVKVYEPGMHINPWLFEKSYLYRWAWPRTEFGDREDRARKVLESLNNFKTLTDQEHVRLSVILLPILEPISTWNNQELWSRSTSIEDFKKLGLRYFDLEGTLETGLKEGVPGPETPGDTWHPSDAMAKRFAEQLKREGLLDKT